MPDDNTKQTAYDLFLSHSSADKPWVGPLCEALERLGLRVFLDESDIQPPENYVLTLNDALRTSRFLVLVATPHSALSKWVRQEWTSFIAEHGPVGRIIVIGLESVELPTLLKTVQQVDATHRDVDRVAAELVTLIGRAGDLPDDDSRALLIGQDLTFVLAQDKDQLLVTDPTGKTRQVEPPWRVGNSFSVARLGFNQLTRQPITTDADRAELFTHGRTLGESMFRLLFATDDCRKLLDKAMIPGGHRPLVTIRSDDDVLLSLPWELLHHDESFLVRDARIDMARSTLAPVGSGALLKEPAGYFKLVVNVSAPEGGGLNYEAESYRITRALSKHCQLVPTELGTLDDLVETTKQAAPTGIHFSGHGSPGRLQFENDEGRGEIVPVGDLMDRLRESLPDGTLPPFFYLASCHGNEPTNPEKGELGAESSAALLHREGVAQVVGYYGPIADELSTLAEEALYTAVAEGRTTRYAVRQARAALAAPYWGPDQKHRPGQPPESPARKADGTTAVSSHPFGWAQLVFYHRGPDRPLSRPIPADATRRLEQELKRTFEGTGKRKILSTGFIGRRTELHRIRRRLRRADRVLVFQGLGGLGKTTLAFHTVPMLASSDDVVTLWCHDAEQQENPGENLVSQLLEFCRARFGHQWEQVVQQVDQAAGEDSAQRFGYFLQNLLANVDRLVVYLDNMESLLVGPKDAGGDEADFASWQAESLQQIWRLLGELARNGDKLHVLASCRYRNPDFEHDAIPVSPLPPDAIYRLMGWHTALRRLSSPIRARLVARLAGHPRAVEYANDLTQDALARYETHHGDWQLSPQPDQAELDGEWQQLVEPWLPQVQEKLRADLLLDAIWDRVLDDHSRRMLYRMTLLRQPWKWDLVQHLGEPDETAAEAKATAERLRQTSLLEQVELFGRLDKDRVGIVRHYTLHPATADFITQQFGNDDDLLRLPSHLRIGEHLEGQAAESPYIETHLEAGYHLFETGEYDRSYELLGSASDWLQNHGRVREGLQVLKPFLAEAVRDAMDKPLVGRLLGTVGLAHANLGQIEKAIGYYEQSLAIAREIGDRRVEGNSLGQLGLAYADLGQVVQAIDHYEQQLVIVREIGDPRGEGNAFGNLGSAYYRLGQVEKAIGYYEQALVIDRDIGDRRGEGNDLGNLGLAYASLGQIEKAIGYYKQALVIARKIGDRRVEGNSLGNLGLAHAHLGQIGKAIGYHEQGLVIHRKIGDRQGEGNALGNLGSAYARLGQVEKAIGYYEQWLDIAREIGDRRGEGNALGNLGLAYAALGQIEKAIGYYEEILVIHRQIGDRRGEGQDLGNLGLAYARLGQVEKAIGYYEQGLAIAREVGDRRGEGSGLGNLGSAYADLGQVEKAIGYLEQTLKIGQEIKNPQIVEIASRQLEQLRSGEEGA